MLKFDRKRFFVVSGNYKWIARIMKHPVYSMNVYVSVYRVCRSLKSKTNDEINASGTRFVRPLIFFLSITLYLRSF